MAGDTIDVAGVGYQVHPPRPLETGAEVTVWVHTVVRENDMSLYAFATRAERDLFLALTRVPGVGPRIALAAIGHGPDKVVAAIGAQDVTALAKIPGVGRKTAAAIAAQVTVSDDLAAALGGGAGEPTVEDQLVQALTGLGVGAADARAAVAQAMADDPGAGHAAWLRAALRHLRRAA